ncbi:beta-alanine transporter-like [Amphibalanus amphitrite]|uniref:beta-alanine transporter-like n=1 Tax=Amphibalanus amphitrite TaxID=1232801 RepID=UPI001C9297A9|nr:beta-alanine transporter-like [Amphibalanus amphitrite]
MYDVNYTRLVRQLTSVTARDNSSGPAPLPTPWPVTPCRHGWRHEPERGVTLMAKFELVCENSQLTSALVAGVGAGAAVGQLVVFSCRNRVSRRWAFLFSLLFYLTTGAVSVTCQRPLCLLLTAPAVAAAAGALAYNQLSLVLELTPASSHHLGHVTERLVTSGAVVLLSGVVTLTRQWSTAVLAVVLPCAVFLLYWCVMPESPVWLVSRGYWSEVHRLLERMARVNGQPTDAGYLTEQLQVITDRLGEEGRLLSSLTYHQAAAESLSRWPGARRPLLLLAAAQLLACPLAWAAARVAGRRSCLLVSLGLSAAVCGLAASLQRRVTSNLTLDALTFTLALLSEISLLLLLLTGCRLLPSLLSSHGLLLLRSAQLLGYTALPALNLLMPEWRLATLAGLHGLGAGAALLLPETLHQPRPRLPSESHSIRRSPTV